MTLTRTSAKNYFLTGLKPTQAQFAELFEGIVFQQGTSAQFVESNVSAQGNWDFKKDVTVSGALTLNSPLASLSVTGIVSAGSLNVSSSVSAASLAISGNATIGGTAVINGTLTPSGGIVGSVNGVAAGVGIVSQFIQSSVPSGSAVPCSTNQTQNITFLDVPPGKWLLWGNHWSAPAGGTTTTILEGGINTTSSAQPTPPAGGADNRWVGSAVGTGISTNAQLFVDISATARHYLVATPTFSGGTLSAYGSLQGIRLP